jgi:hypothetical protein
VFDGEAHIDRTTRKTLAALHVGRRIAPVIPVFAQLFGYRGPLPEIFLEAEQVPIGILHQKLSLTLGDTGLRGIPALCQRAKQRYPVLLTHGHHGTHIGYFDLQVDAAPKW